ncbi:hypothetical protein ACK8GG_03975 [Micromonosporaceae bacterium DT55]|uniref:hypothetical protein n=1 Tax=Melissospora conviva TaxID=3388432 RepID=UPI003C181502
MTTTAAATTLRRPSPVRVLTWLLAATATVTVAVEVLNFWYAPEQGFALGVRTGWALLRAFGFVLLIGQVRRGRAGARPFGLILAVTTVFAVGRLIVPRSGVPPLPGLIGFALLTLLCVAVTVLLYRSQAVRQALNRHPRRLVLDRDGFALRETPPRRPETTGRLLTARVAALTYSPLMLLPALIAVSTLGGGRLHLLPVVVAWLGAGVLVSYVVLLGTFFLLRGRDWARRYLVVVTLAVLAIQLPLSWWLLGLDGLIRDGAPLLAAAGITLYALRPGPGEPT